MVTQRPSYISILRIGGAFLAVFSVVVAALILYVIPIACSFVGNLQLVVLGFLFVGGVLSFFVGQGLARRRRR
ncbi:MAG: hypothetical protein ACE5LA_00015 [Dehalococcoidales bacterium]